MAREITQRELRNQSGEIMRGLDRGESFVVSRNGVPVGELRPIRRDTYVSVTVMESVFGGAPAINGDQFRSDVDSMLDQGAAPRA